MDSVKLESEFQNIVIEDDNISFGMTINSIGCKSIMPDEHIANSNKIEDIRQQFKKGKESDEFKLIYITNGVGYVRFENRSEIEISNGMILFIRPHQKYSYYHLRDTEWKEYFLRFETQASYDYLLRKLFPIDNSIIVVGFNDELVKIFQKAIVVIQQKLNLSEVYLSGMLFHILGLIISESKNKTIKERESQKIEQAKIIMSESIFTTLSPVELASKLDMNYVSFRKLFKDITGFAPAKYLMALKILKAKDILINSSCSIKKISSDLCFDSPDSFNKTFKKNTGYTGRGYRLNYMRTSK